MKKWLTLLFCLSQLLLFSQNKEPEIFSRISESMKTFKIDTSAVPKDRLTEKIRDLRALKGGFNINEAMEYKIAEARSKKEITDEEYEKLKTYLTTGNGKKWIDNSMIWIYRNHLTLREIRQAIKFYKTPAGKKMARDFPLIMVESVKAAETVMDYGLRKK